MTYFTKIDTGIDIVDQLTPSINFLRHLDLYLLL